MSDAASTSSAEWQPGAGGRPVMIGWMQQIVPYGIFTTDRNLRITSWNEWLATHSGRRTEGVLGRNLRELYPDLVERRLDDRYTRALDGEVSLISTALHKYLLPFAATMPSAGLPHMLQTCRIAPLVEGGVISGTITIIEDVTQREVQAATLSRQQELDRLLSDSLAMLLLSEDPVQEMAGIFGSMRLALGLDAYVCYLLASDEKSLRHQSSVGLSPEQRELISILPVEEADRAFLRGGAGEKLEVDRPALRPLRSAGLRSQISVPMAVGDRFFGMVAFGSYERETIPLHDGNILLWVARYVAIALDRSHRQNETRQASRAKDDFLAALSHELRTPLNPILLVASDAALNTDYPDEAREAFRVIEKNALLEAQLIDDLLDLTRIAHGKMALEMQAVPLEPVIREALDSVRAELLARDLKLTVALECGDHLVMADSGRLLQVFWNVLKNAVKFTPPGGHIIVASVAMTARGEATVKVADTGIGMLPHELERIFDAFSQGDHVLPRYSHRFGGLGLGLAISRKLIEMHGGRIVAESAGRNFGSTFTITLPLIAKDESREVVVAKTNQGAGQEGVPRRSNPTKQILLVEDHEATRLSLRRLLERRGYRVVAVGSASAAIDEAAATAFDLVLSDIGLPGDDGFSLMQKLRDRFSLKGIALTGYGMEEDLARSNDAGFFAHLTKPISVGVLDRVLERAFRAT